VIKYLILMSVANAIRPYRRSALYHAYG